MDFQEKLENYAKLLVIHGMNVQPGQVVNVTCEVSQQALARLITKACYERGAKYVHVDFVDPILNQSRLLNSKEESFLSYVPPYIKEKYDGFVDENAAIIRIIGNEEPEALKNVDPKKANEVQASFRKSIKRYYVEGVGKSKIHWTVAAASTPKWAKRLFPELTEEKAHMALWDEIFKICRADQPDYLKKWQEHNTILTDRAKKLTDLKIKTLHFKGPDTDLKVYLSEKAKFKGGSDKGPYGKEYEPNIPTEECFTTPDRRYTEGKAKVTRPILINGQMVSGLKIEFKEGRLHSFTAEEGKDTFEAYINNDPGARYLGEVALVGIDSPVYQSGHIFEEILYDENAACHIAIGFAYHFCLENGPNMSEKELQELGYNESHVHTDMMISSEEVDVIATTYSGKEVTLIQKGQWTNFIFN